MAGAGEEEVWENAEDQEEQDETVIKKETAPPVKKERVKIPKAMVSTTVVVGAILRNYPRITLRDRNMATTATFNAVTDPLRAFDALKAAVAALDPVFIQEKRYAEAANAILETMRKLAFACTAVEFGDNWSSVVSNYEEQTERRMVEVKE